MSPKPKKVVIVGGGFAGLNAAKMLGDRRQVEVTLIDRRNYHLFQPLLYQVAMAALSPAEIAAPIRGMLSGYKNITVLQDEVVNVDAVARTVASTTQTYAFDYLVLVCGAQHAYFGHNEWEEHAPGLKTVEQATEIRRRVLMAFERAECASDSNERRRQLTFVIIGGGPTGVELAGAIGEMSRFTLAKDFHNIDPKLTRIVLIEAGPRILPTFSPASATQATRDLEALGVQVWTSAAVSKIDASGVEVGRERLEAGTMLWAAGVMPSVLNSQLGAERDYAGRAIVGLDLSLANQPHIFVIGDQAHAKDANGQPLPGLAPVAMQQGRFVAKAILRDIDGKPRGAFKYRDKGRMATIGRSRAVAELGGMRFKGFLAWVMWLFVHVYYITGFKNRLFVILDWAYSYFTVKRGARLIVSKEWRFYPTPLSINETNQQQQFRDSHT